MITLKKIEAVYTQANTYANNKNENANSIQGRSKRTIKKSKYEDSILSDEEIFDSCESESIEDKISYELQAGQEDDVIMQGKLLYRYSLNQIELEGFWSMNNDATQEKFSYLLLKEKERLICPINILEMNNSNHSNYINHYKNAKHHMNSSTQNFKEQVFLSICAANLHEAILIPHNKIFNTILNFLSGEYHGFFMYYDKTIEDRFNLNLTIVDNQVRISGEGTNNLGNFNILGYINFYTTKGNYIIFTIFFIIEDLILRNDKDAEQIYLGEFKFTRMYNAFNPNENYRVIKSYQHRRRKNIDYSEHDSNI
jgi:hypothetical protein